MSAKGFLIYGIPLCCVCEEYYAQESGDPKSFILTRKTIDMDHDKKCACGEWPDTNDWMVLRPFAGESHESKIICYYPTYTPITRSE